LKQIVRIITNAVGSEPKCRESNIALASKRRAPAGVNLMNATSQSDIGETRFEGTIAGVNRDACTQRQPAWANWALKRTAAPVPFLAFLN
jgi:hypothetical protein